MLEHWMQPDVPAAQQLLCGGHTLTLTGEGLCLLHFQVGKCAHGHWLSCS
jgi:hypothetical protein